MSCMPRNSSMPPGVQTPTLGSSLLEQRLRSKSTPAEPEAASRVGTASLLRYTLHGRTVYELPHTEAVVHSPRDLSASLGQYCHEQGAWRRQVLCPHTATSARLAVTAWERHDQADSDGVGLLWTSSIWLACNAPKWLGWTRARVPGEQPMRVLDLGAGLGIAAAALAYNGCSVIATETSAGMPDLVRTCKPLTAPHLGATRMAAWAGSLHCQELHWSAASALPFCSAGQWCPHVLLACDVLYCQRATAALVEFANAWPAAGQPVVLCAVADAEAVPGASAHIRAFARAMAAHGWTCKQEEGVYEDSTSCLHLVWAQWP